MAGSLISMRFYIEIIEILSALSYLTQSDLIKFDLILYFMLYSLILRRRSCPFGRVFDQLSSAKSPEASRVPVLSEWYRFGCVGRLRPIHPNSSE